MYPVISNHWLGFSIQAISPITLANVIALQSIGRIANLQIDVSRDLLGLSLRQMKLLVEMKDRRKLITEEGTLAGAIGQRFVTHAKAFVQIARETQQDLIGLVAVHNEECAAESTPQEKCTEAA